MILNIFLLKCCQKILKLELSKELSEWFKDNINFFINTSSDSAYGIHRLPKLLKFMNSEEFEQT